MTRKIAIIGGGISGLSLLHFLKQKYPDADSAKITLFEKNHIIGGTIRSISKDGCIFECGPNGFLDSKPLTLRLLHDVGLDESIIHARAESSVRYVAIGGKLHEFPSGPKGFLGFEPFNPLQKLRAFAEPLILSKSNPKESVHDFGARRFGSRFAEVMLDPLVSGIFGGNAKTVSLNAAFPKIYDMERNHGSLFRAMIAMRKSRNDSSQPMKGKLASLRGGMAELIARLGSKYGEHIVAGGEIAKVLPNQNSYDIHRVDGSAHKADEIYCCAPSYSAGPIMRGINSTIANGLDKIKYAPIAVVGLVYARKHFRKNPEGYGYLIPSGENKKVLGVLFEHNIFPGRCPDDQAMFRVMIGGERHPGIFELSKDQLVHAAQDEIQSMLDVQGEPVQTFYIPWKKAIPQYDQAYCDIRDMIHAELKGHPRLHLIANYLNGVSMNDCIESAYQGAQGSTLN